MNEIIIDLENEIIKKIAFEEYIERFVPEIRDAFYAAYGDELENRPKTFIELGELQDKFFEGLLELNNPRSQMLILMRYGILNGVPMTLQQVADKFGVTRARARQIEQYFLRKFRSRLKKSKRLVDYLDN